MTKIDVTNWWDDLLRAQLSIMTDIATGDYKAAMVELNKIEKVAKDIRNADFAGKFYYELDDDEEEDD